MSIKGHRSFSATNLVAVTITFFFFLNSAFSQDSVPLSLSESREAKLFAKQFQMSLQNSKDLNRVPKYFFARGFLNRLLQDSFWLMKDKAVVERLSRKKRLAYETVMFNITYMAGLYGFATNIDAADIKSENMFPPSVLKVIRRDAELSRMFDSDSNEDESIGTAHLPKSMAVLNDATVEFRRYLNKHTATWKPRYNEKVKSVDNAVDERPSKYPCEGPNCEGLAQNTIFIDVTSFPFDLTLISERGKLKIYRLAPISR